MTILEEMDFYLDKHETFKEHKEISVEDHSNTHWLCSQGYKTTEESFESPITNLIIEGTNFKVFSCQCKFIQSLKDMLEIVYFYVPLSKIKYFDGTLAIMTLF